MLPALTILSVSLLAAPAHPQWTPPVPVAGDDQIAPLAHPQTKADVAAGGLGYLVVWEDHRVGLGAIASAGGTPMESDVFAMRLDAQGNPLDDRPIMISSAPWDQTDPRVAWNGQHWLVVWQSERPTQFWHTRNVVAARIAPDGTVVDDPPLIIDDDDNIDEFPWDVASDGTDWAVFWQDTGTSGYTLDGAVVAANGTVGAPQRILAPGNFGTPWNLRAEWAQNRYLIAYEAWESTSWDIKGMLLDASLNVAGTAFPICGNGYSQTRATVGSNGSDFYVAWQDDRFNGTIYGTPVSVTGSVGVSDGVELSGGLFLASPSPAAAWDGVGWTVMFDSWSYPAGSVLHVTQVDAAGQIRPGGGAITVAAHGALVMDPALAPQANGVLAAWTDGRLSPGSQDVYGCVVQAGGTVGPQAPLSIGPPAQITPDVSGHEDLRLVTWLSRTSGTARVLAQRVDFFGRPLDAQPIVLATGSRDLQDPAVAWDESGVWLVAWEDYAGSVFQSRILGKRVDAAGNVLDAQPIAVMAGNQPDVDAVAGEFLVAATHEPINHQRSPKAARVRARDGAVLDPTPLVLGTIYARGVNVAALDDRWMVAWQSHPTHDSPWSTIKVNTVIGGAPQTLRAPTSSTATERGAAVASDGVTTLLSWSDGADLRAMRLDPTGLGLDPAAGFFVSGAPNNQFDGSVAWNGLRWQTAWTDYRAQTGLVPGRGDVFGARVDAAGTVLNPAGLPLLDGVLPEGGAELEGGRGAAVAVSSSFVAAASERGNWAVRTQFRGPSLEVTSLQRGQSATWTASGAEPGDAVWFALAGSLTQGGGPCPPALGGLCVDLAGNVTLLGQDAADGQGVASITLNVPAGAPLVSTHHQAVVLRGAGGTLSAKTPAVTRVVQP